MELNGGLISLWWGGMVRVTKGCLKKAIDQQRLTYEELLTILTEEEAVINNRPLKYIDEEDIDSVLTPSHLFCGRRTINVPREREPANPCNLDAEDVVRRIYETSEYCDRTLLEKLGKRVSLRIERES